MEQQKPLRVAVIGGGLVGSLSACFFAKRGHNVEIYEYRPDIRTSEHVSRGRTINLSLSTRGRRALRRISASLEQRVLNGALPLRGRMMHLPGGILKAAPYDPLESQCIYSVDRKLLNQILLNESEAFPNVKAYFGHKLIEANLESGVLKFQRCDTSEVVEKHSDLTVGADGAFSAVRRRMMTKRVFNFSQQYIDHRYLELAIPPNQFGEFAMAEDYLHLWPRGECLMIAMPNRDRSWTVTLFLPVRLYESISSQRRLLDFFGESFPDAIPLIGKEKLIKDFFQTKPSPLVSIKCRPYHVSDRAVIIGDAAHAMVPFYGQGMNAGFEDCELLDTLLSQHSVANALSLYSEMRWVDAHEICDLALYNFSELSSLVTQRWWSLRRSLDNWLHRTLGARWLPLYQGVCFTHEAYSRCARKKQRQDKLITWALLAAVLVTSTVLLFTCLSS